MTNRLELNWKLDGFVDEQRYYCSETAFTADTKPVAKAVFANDVRSYTDEVDVKIAKKRYIAISSVRNNVEKFSSRFTTYCLPDSVIPQVWSDFKSNIADDFAGAWASRNGASVVNGVLKLDRNLAQYLDMSSSNDFHFNGTGDVTLRCKLKVSAFSSGIRVLFTTRYNDTAAAGAARNWSIFLTPTCGIRLNIWSSSVAGSIIEKQWEASFQFNEEFEFSLERKNMVWSLYVNGNIFGSSVTQSTTYTPNLAGKLTIGSERNAGVTGNTERDLDGEVSMFQIIKRVALGNGSVTPTI